jgi:hypothetical protein
MNLSESENITSKLKIGTIEKEAILKLIDLKIDNDMEKVLTEMRRLEDKQDAKFGALETKFSIILWAIGILIALIVALKVIN